MKSSDLFCSISIFNSDDDDNPFAEIIVGYDEKFNLIAMLELTDYDFPEYSCRTWAEISKEEAYELAKRLNVSMVSLPEAILDSVDEEYYEIINPSIRVVRECFQEIIDCFIYDHCRIRIRRTYDSRGCCIF